LVSIKALISAFKEIVLVLGIASVYGNISPDGGISMFD